jgi:hypothetical protein
VSLWGREQDNLEAEERHLLLQRIVAARNGAHRQEADRALVEATRWLRQHPNDAVIYEARDQLRAEFPAVH